LTPWLWRILYNTIFVYRELSFSWLKQYITKIDDSGQQVKTESKQEYINRALKNLWVLLRNEYNNDDLSIPIIGTGISKSVDSKYLEILEICISFFNESKKQKIINNLEIYVYQEQLTINTLKILKATLLEVLK
jgi:hypothetical protein